MTISRRRLLAASLALPALPALRPLAAQATARIGIVHVNDFHSRHEGALANGANCRPGQDCLGGSARLVTAIKQARAAAQAEGRAVLSLDGGDQFMGSLFYTLHRGAAEAAIQQEWGVEAMALGNHEFDHGPANLARYLRTLDKPVLAANLDTTDEPELQGLVRPALEFRRDGLRVVVIGLITETTPQIASPGPRLRFRDAEEATERAVAQALAAGPAMVVVLSHRGIEADQRMAARVRGVDVIVGGHSHTILANRPDAYGPAPVVVDGPDRGVRIVQAGALGRFVGRLDLDVAATGRVAAHKGDARELTPDIAEDPAAAAIVARFAAPLGEVRARAVASAASAFDNATCRSAECAIGNAIAEALLAAAPGSDLALHNAGGIRASFPAGTITYGDILTTMPFGNTVATVTVRGGDLRAAIENGLSQPGQGRFPQIAGMRIVADLSRPAGQRLVSAEILAGERAGPLDNERAYRVVTNNFVRRGGDGYVSFRDAALESYDTGPLVEEVVAAWMAARSPLAPQTDGRITLR
jgi:5'-nucleotidase